ncbi:MAG: NERD domain-containing protein, partial [Chthoniobacteraceae bacterium]
DGLDSRWTVLHSVSWIARQPRRHAQDGEADFLLFHPEGGLLVVEVKGGGIRRDATSGEWFSIDRGMREHHIKDPFAQARRAQHVILDKLREHPDWSRVAPRRVLAGYGVAFPDIQRTDQLSGPDRPNAIIATANEMSSISRWIESAFAWWRNEDPSVARLGGGAVTLIERAFARDIRVAPLVSQRLAEEEQQRIQLTAQQARLLRALGARRRVAIKGGAGTGKTVLALEKARQLAREGFRTLLLCFNRPLAEHLGRVEASSLHIEIRSFHELCGDRVQRVLSTTGRDFLRDAQQEYPRGDKFRVQLPYALALAVEETGERFDAIVVDEAQDFHSEFWLPIEMLLADTRHSPLYVFYDNNQAVYRRPEALPIPPEDEFELTVNCRNTRAIHEAAYRYYQGSHTDPPPIAGVPVALHTESGMTGQVQTIARLVREFIQAGRVLPEDIAVLIGDPTLRAPFQQMLTRHSLPRGLTWAFDATPQPSSIRAESCLRFKGLEAAILLLCGVDTLTAEEHRETLYVALSRAKSELHILGEASALSRIAN